jgi:hypothetical protein
MNTEQPAPRGTQQYASAEDNADAILRHGVSDSTGSAAVRVGVLVRMNVHLQHIPYGTFQRSVITRQVLTPCMAPGST